MQLMSKNKIVPKLRFPAFEYNYEEHKLSDLITRYSEKNKDEEFMIDSILSLSSIYGIVDRKELLGDTYDKVNHLSYIKTRFDDFVYGKSISASFPYGVFKANKCRDGLLSTLYYTFKVNNNINVDYLDCYFSHFNRANNFLKKHVLVGDRYITADVNYILSGKIFIPLEKEQKKIASFLRAINKKLQQLNKKKELLKDYKKGVMQKIFSQELRFKDEFGNNYSDWENKKLGEICDVIVGGTPSTQKKEYWNGDIGWISSGSLNDGNVTQPSKLITKLGLDNSSAKMMPENTVMLAMTGATLGKIGYLKFNSSANQSVAGFLPNETYNSKYLFYTLQHGINQVFKCSGGAAQQGINKQSILNLKYRFASIDEQHKVANFLSSIDKKIESVNSQIGNTKVFKKGLLQQMFV